VILAANSSAFPLPPNQALIAGRAGNNQEFERHRVDDKVDDRTLNEIYFPAFKAAVQEAGVWSVMSAYNKLNGQWCAENPSLLTGTLQKKWGFKGLVVSDRAGTYSTEDSIKCWPEPRDAG